MGVPITLDQYNQFYIQFQSISSINTGDTNNFIRDESQFGNTTRWNKGRHNITFGGEYHHARGDIVNNFRAQGRFYFTKTAGYTGYDVADFLIGRWAEFIQGAGEFKNTRFNIINAFFNDSFKINRRLTLDLGVRWEPFFPNTDLHRESGCLGRPQRSLHAVRQCARGHSLRRRPGRSGRRVQDYLGQLRSARRPGLGCDRRRQDRRCAPDTGSSTTASIRCRPTAQRMKRRSGRWWMYFGGPTDSMANPYLNVAGGNPFPKIGFDAIGTEVLNPGKNGTFSLPMAAFLYGPDLRNPYVSSWNLTVERQLGGKLAGTRVVRRIERYGSDQRARLQRSLPECDGYHVHHEPAPSVCGATAWARWS